jgi:hypothetical protein
MSAADIFSMPARLRMVVQGARTKRTGRTGRTGRTERTERAERTERRTSDPKTQRAHASGPNAWARPATDQSPTDFRTLG